jgi:hypothetical protein
MLSPAFCYVNSQRNASRFSQKKVKGDRLTPEQLVLKVFAPIHPDPLGVAATNPMWAMSTTIPQDRGSLRRSMLKAPTICVDPLRFSSPSIILLAMFQLARCL